MFVVVGSVENNQFSTLVRLKLWPARLLLELRKETQGSSDKNEKSDCYYKNYTQRDQLDCFGICFLLMFGLFRWVSTIMEKESQPQYKTAVAIGSRKKQIKSLNY